MEMERDQGPSSELEEETAEEAGVTVVYNSPYRKPKQTHLLAVGCFV